MRLRLRASLALAALTMAGCADTAKPDLTLGSPPAAHGPLSAEQRGRKAVDLLLQGLRDQARAEVVALLAAAPDDRLGRSLLEQIDKDPMQLLGEKSYAYTVKRGDTLVGLADRFLGDPYLFYVLARYNNIAIPSQSQVGGVLRIPGTPKPLAPTVRKPKAGAAAAIVPSQAPQPARDVARANRLRAGALKHLNSGAVGQAVDMLQQAQAADPANAAVRRDLDRALRIQATLRTR